MKKNEYFEGVCTSMSHDGKGVVKHDGFTYFVSGMILEEKGLLKVIKVLKNYGIARLVEILEPSSYRIDALCPSYKLCGGCQLQHLSTKGQQVFKTNRVKECMQRIGHCDVEVQPCMMMEEPVYYRNKVQVPVGNSHDGLVSGFYKTHTNDIIPFDECFIQNKQSNSIVKRTRELLEKSKEVAYDRTTKKGNIRHILTKFGASTNQIMLVIITRHKTIKSIDSIVEVITKEFPMIQTIIHNINSKDDNVILGKQEITLYGKGYIEDVLLGNTYKISLKSFYQINPIQVEVLYKTAINLTNLKETDEVLDAYCGIGTIGLSLAKYVKKVHGVEIVEQAIIDAKQNAIDNSINNATFTCLDAGDYMVDLAKKGKQLDVVFVDPPRKGCSMKFLESLVQLSPKKVTYISCDVSTQARDIAYLQEHGYVATYCQPVDMFPHTHHVESIVLMSKIEQ